MDNTRKTAKSSNNEATTDAIAVINSQEVLGKNFTIYGTYENPLFLEKDVAEWIDYKNITDMVRNVDPDEKLTSQISNSGQIRHQLFLTEDGLYEVLMQSTKSIAKSFKKEVKKILKELRIKGCLPPPPDTSEMVSIQRRKLKILQLIADVSTSNTHRVHYDIDDFKSLLEPDEAMLFRMIIEKLKRYYS